MTLPNFIIIGAYKSGTTSLYHYLRQHPDIFMPNIKEPNFFAHEKKTNLVMQEDQNQHTINDIDTYTKLFSNVNTEKAIGEASPIYLGTPFAAQRIKATIPDVKLIAILRQPIDAFYSDHNMRIRDKRNLENDFRERVKGIGDQIDSGETSGPMYFKQLKIYYDLFDASRINVYLYDDLRKNTLALVRNIYKFLNVDDKFSPDFAGIHNIGGIPKVNVLNDILKKIIKKQKIQSTPLLRNSLAKLQQLNMTPFPPLSATLKSELTNIFRTDIQNLEKLIDRDLSDW